MRLRIGHHLRREETIFRFLVVLLLLSPLPFGSNRPWSWSLLAFAVGILTMWWGLLLLRNSHREFIPIGGIKWIVAPFMLTLAWSFVQAYLPIPIDRADPLWNQTAAALGGSVDPRLSLDPGSTKTALMKLASYGAVFFLSLQLCHSRRRTRRLFFWIAAGAAMYSLYGVTVFWTGARRILWYNLDDFAAPSADHVVSTFINHNHYATYAGLGLICLLAVMADKIPRTLSATGDSGRISSEETSNLASYIVPGLLAFVILISGLVLSHSRAGLVFTLLAVAVYMAMFVFIFRRAKSIRVGLAMALLAMTAMVYTISGYTFEKRMERLEESGEFRFALYEATKEGIAHRPWSGIGHGAYSHAIKRYKNIGLFQQLDTAHNVYLESAMELGIPASFSLFASIAAILLICVRGMKRSHSGRPYSAAGLAALILVGFHSIFDFSMQIPAVAVTFAAIAGAACSRSFGSSRARVSAHV
ncbi:MAG: O-antigen ligase family protein [Nitrospinota bacterium]|nr:O-antigen ligase family protein [Nitrospinota bacterium]